MRIILFIVLLMCNRIFKIDYKNSVRAFKLELDTETGSLYTNGKIDIWVAQGKIVELVIYTKKKIFTYQ